MKMYTKAFNKMSELTDYVNEIGLEKDDIISIVSSNGMYFLSWYAE